MAASAIVCWDRTPTRIIGVGHHKPLVWLRTQLTYFHDVLIARVRGLEESCAESGAPTATALGMIHVRGRPDYPPLRAALSQRFGEDTPAPVRNWWEPEVLELWNSAAAVMRDSIPANGGHVVLTEEQAKTWLVVLPPFTTMYSVLRGVVPLATDTREGDIAKLGPDYLPVAGPVDQARAEWLRLTRDDLHEIIHTPRPP